MASKIFISYRRDDSAGTAGRLHDRLAETFGEENLFIDVDNMPAGADFVETLNKQVANCDVFLCTVGPNWLNAKDDDGRRRLDQPDDFVRVEIAAALNRNIPVIPVLVDGARVPKDHELPNDIAPLTRRQAVEVRNSHFRRDADELTQKIGGLLKEQRSAPSRAVLAAVVGAAALLMFGTIGLYQAGIVSLPGMHSGPTAPTVKELPSKEAVSALKPLASTPGASTTNQTRVAEAAHPDLVTDCDRLAADPTDLQRPRSVPGVWDKQINVAAALQTCQEAVIKYPDVGRFSLSLGRALFLAKDYPASLKQFERAVSFGNTAAMNAIAILYRDGYGVPQDYGEARRWYEEAAAAGNSPIAMNSIGSFYENGRGVPQDYAEAKRWYQKAVAAANSPVGMTSIGSLYENGRGVPQDYAEAKRWYQKAADFGNSTAMVHLGDMYRDGRGAAKSVADARTWYEQAAVAGSAVAQNRLAVLPSQ
jgi:tetratricopeptide (TPR) repeat protein